MSKTSIPQVGSNGNSPLSDEQTRIEGLWDILPGILWKLSKSGMILDANQAALEFSGYPKEEFLGHLVDEFFLYGLEFQNLLSAVLPTGKAKALLAGLRCHDGSTRDIVIDASTADSGETIFCAIHDQSVQRRTEDHALAQAVSV
jgi:PAS domain S-box-containing protein